MNDPDRTDYTYPVVIPYLNMAIEELSELLEETNSSPSSSTAVVTVPVGISAITPAEDLTVGVPHYPDDLTELQEVGERRAGDTGPFNRLARKENGQVFPVNSSLLFWYWENQKIRFNPAGASAPVEVQLKYVSQALPYVSNEFTIITAINARSYLAYKTAALCARFIGEDESRAGMLEEQADKAVDRTITISNKGRQQIVTRHRPFRAAFKSRGGF
jgi:hypothetical protein